MGSIINIAIIMCGSRGYNNYRHQADLYTWTNILLNRGFKRENIITFSYNDLPILTNNTIQHTCYGPNMYRDDFVNYTLHDASKEQFLKTLKNISNKNANILIIYINHGAYNLLSTPNTFDQPIYVDDFAEAVNTLASKVRKICVVIEACYSGSMAFRARYAKNVIFITAADAKQSSYSYCWCPELKAYTTDEFTYHMLNYLDSSSNDRKSLKELFEDVKSKTVFSNVMSSGNMYRVQLKEFFGVMKKNKPVLGNTTIDNVKRIKNTIIPENKLRRIYKRVKNILYVTHGMRVEDYYEKILRKYKHEVTDKDTTTEKQTQKDSEKVRDTIKLIKNPDVEQKCYKRITSSAIQMFMNTYLNEDNIEFINDLGLLCTKFDVNEILSTMEFVSKEIHEKEHQERNTMKRIVKDKTVPDVSEEWSVEETDDLYTDHTEISETEHKKDGSHRRTRNIYVPKRPSKHYFRKHKSFTQENVQSNSIISSFQGAVEQAISIQRPGKRPWEEESEDEEEIPTPTPTPRYGLYKNKHSSEHLDEYPYADRPAVEVHKRYRRRFRNRGV